jgi:hypothetical protein
MALKLEHLEVVSFATTSAATTRAAFSDEACVSPLCGPSEMPTGCADTIATG